MLNNRLWSNTLLSLAFCYTGQTCAWAESKPLELKWTELAPMIGGNHVELALNEGTTIRGEAVALREDTLVMDVKSSSGVRAYPKGSSAIPRSAITLIKVQRSRGTWGRSMGTVVGVVSGLGIGGYTGAHAHSDGAGVGVFVAITSGVAVLGYYAGKKLDRRMTVIKVVP